MIAGVIAFLQIIFRLLADLFGLIALSVRPRRSIEAENLFLRRELALFKERGIRPRRVDAATRLSLVFLSRLFDWRDGRGAPRNDDPLAPSRLAPVLAI
jgi:putative transposase